KIGITPNVQTLCKIVQRIRKQQPSCPIIWDPVLKSSSGVVFFNRHDTVGLNDVLQGIHLVTPNLPEYEVLKNSGIGDAGPCAVLLKGGHDLKRTGHDTLFHQGHEICIAPTFADVHEKHGSGCVLSSAIAAYIAKGE